MVANSKRDRAIALARALYRLGPMPCGCIPRIKACWCETLSCKCPFEVEVCQLEEGWYRARPKCVKRHTDEGTDVRFDHLRPRDEMPPVSGDHWDAWILADQAEVDEQHRHIAALIDLYSATDHEHYRETPLDPNPDLDRHTVTSRKLRLDLMADRVAAGFSPFHHSDACNKQLKVGENLSRGRNGAIIYRGVG
jgi:hypothetical protein